MSPPTTRPRPTGFTLIELLVVITVMAVLVAILLPAIGAAVQNARNAAVSAEINQIVQGLANFKSKYGDYPPSRIILAEDGNYNPTRFVDTGTNIYATGTADMSDRQLAQRSLRYLRKFFPRVEFSTNGPASVITSTNWYDFNGNGNTVTSPEIYVLQGHECLAFFLGGIPSISQDPGGKVIYSMTGFSKDPRNPFTAAGTNRHPSLFEFNSDRLVDDPNEPNPKNHFPGYLDSLKTNQYYAYFSAYGNNAYDPNDVNFPDEDDSTGTSPITLRFLVTFPIQGSTTNPTAISASPNPYTTSLTYQVVPTPKSVTYQNPQTFQIISAGGDALYGVGGSYSSSASTPLAVDGTTNPASPYNSTDITIRSREKDNITSFHNGKLD